MRSFPLEHDGHFASSPGSGNRRDIGSRAFQPVALLDVQFDIANGSKLQRRRSLIVDRGKRCAKRYAITVLERISMLKRQTSGKY